MDSKLLNKKEVDVINEFIKNTDPTLGEWEYGWSPLKTETWCALSRMRDYCITLLNKIDAKKIHKIMSKRYKETCVMSELAKSITKYLEDK